MAELFQRILTDIVAVISQSTGDVLLISILLFLFMGGVLISYWLYNRRKFQNLSHQIPASVVKNYLDSIIQNSTSLKSSLFRGGGLEIGDGIPSVVPTRDLPSGGAGSGISQEELNQKNAEIAALKGQLGGKDETIRDLEKKLAEAQEMMASGDQGEQVTKLSSDKAALEEELKSAKEALEKAKSETGDSGETQKKLDDVTSERDDLKAKLADYEVIEEDLANLKKLQEENKQLKEEIEKLKGGQAPAPEPPPPSAEPEPAPAAEAAPPEEEKKEEEPPVEEGEQKSAEELLSEFEKMLG